MNTAGITPLTLPGTRTGGQVSTLPFTVLDLGFCPYREAWDLQKQIHSQRLRGDCGDILILVEHEPVYTLGRNADPRHLLAGRHPEIKVYQVERGGDVTYHGPGQLVAYPIFDLHGYRLSISWFMHSLEEVLIRTLAEFGITAGRKPDLTGVWVEDAKIAALGVRLSRWVSMHGLALNVNPDLSLYDGIIPCGIPDYGVTSMQLCSGRKLSLTDVKPVLVKHAREVFPAGMNCSPGDPEV